MDFSLREEQSILADSIARFINTDYEFDERQKALATPEGFSRDKWRTFAELGWTAVPFAETDGGLDGGPVELMLIMEQFGRGLVIEPFLANIVLAGGVLRRIANTAQREQWLAPLIEGELQAAFGFAEAQSRYDTANISTTAIKDGAGYIINGKKSVVLNGPGADLLIIAARTSGEQTNTFGISLFAVSAKTAGLSKQSYATVDGSQAAEITLHNVEVSAAALLGEADHASGTIKAVLDDATLAVSAEAIGIMQTMHDKTVEYTKNRVQFDVPISSFQALQHRMVDTLMLCEESRSLLYWCVMLGEAQDDEYSRAISALKYKIGIAGTKVAEEAVQLHGGMGMTWEMDIAHYFKRIAAINILFGNADYHLDRYASLSNTEASNS